MMLVFCEKQEKQRNLYGVSYDEGEIVQLYFDNGNSYPVGECTIDTRREIVWIEHDGSDKCPVDKDDLIVADVSGQDFNFDYYTYQARGIRWPDVKRYRVIEKAQPSQNDR